MTPLPLPELELLKRWGNHAEFARKLDELALRSDLPTLKGYVGTVATAWFRLGIDHLEDATKSLSIGAQRSSYSRAYYAAYNISKSIRFAVKGFVSLKGDDHKSVGDLPDDFPDSVVWSSRLVRLYENRLRADYDNWQDTASAYTATPRECVEDANGFRKAGSAYLLTKFGLAV